MPVAGELLPQLKLIWLSLRVSTGEPLNVLLLKYCPVQSPEPLNFTQLSLATAPPTFSKYSIWMGTLPLGRSISAE